VSGSGLQQVELVVRAIAQSAVDNEKHFGDLDAVVGDGDFGYSLARGFEKVLEGWDDIDRTDLAIAVLTHLGQAYDALTSGGVAAAGERAAYRAVCTTLGRQVRLQRLDAPDVVGTAVEVDEQGRLVIDGDGERTAWAAGDVVHVRPVR